jgi:hypothetical protein
MNVKRTFPIPGMLFVLCVSLACNLTGAAPDATPAPTTENQEPADVSVSYQGASFSIPGTLASGANAQSTTDVELPFTNPGYGDMPEHIKFTLENYAVPTRPAYVMVFPAEAYAQYTEQTGQTVAALKELPESVDTLSPPLLEYSLYAQAKVLPFQNGRGLRYLTQVMQAPLPLNNQEMFYWFSGVTGDGKFHISAIFPAGASFLPTSGDIAAAVPAGGVPFPNDFDIDQITQYFDQVKQKLDGAGANSFTPSLEALDALVESLQVVSP